MINAPPDAPVLLYDGVCGFCNWSVQMILDHDRHGTMKFAALQSQYGQTLVERHPELKHVDSVVFFEPATDTIREGVYVRSNAALRVANYLGGAWKLFLIARIIPVGIRDFLYDLFARYRYRLFGKYDTCMLPPENVRMRFLD